MAWLVPAIGFYGHAKLNMPAAMLTSENYTDRPIYSFWINGLWGGNLSAMGGGGIMCCSNFEGSTEKITWVLDMTRKQQLQGAVEERHELELAIPKRAKGERYLHVRFDPGNKVRLGWSPDLFSPFESRQPATAKTSSQATSTSSHRITNKEQHSEHKE